MEQIFSVLIFIFPHLTLINAAFLLLFNGGGGAIIYALKSTQKSGFRGKAW